MARRKSLDPALPAMVGWLGTLLSMTKGKQCAMAIELAGVPVDEFREFQASARRGGFKVKTWPLEKGNAAIATKTKGRRIAISVTVTTTEDHHAIVPV